MQSYIYTSTFPSPGISDSIYLTECCIILGPKMGNNMTNMTFKVTRSETQTTILLYMEQKHLHSYLF